MYVTLRHKIQQPPAEAADASQDHGHVIVVHVLTSVEGLHLLATVQSFAALIVVFLTAVLLHFVNPIEGVYVQEAKQVSQEIRNDIRGLNA